MVRLEWIHALAGNQRWKEHLILVREELRRTHEYFQYVSNAWLAREPPPDHNFVEPQMANGYQAFMYRQSQVYAGLASQAHGLYRTVVPESHP